MIHNQTKTGNPSCARLLLSKKSQQQQLVTAHHLAAYLGLDDTIFTHLSCRCPENNNLFYLTPFGTLFEEVTSSSLLTLTLSGDLISPPASDPLAPQLNPAGGILHSAFYEADPTVQCVIHLHSPGALAISSLKEGLLPLSQFSMIFYNRLAYHDFEGISLDPAEKEHLIQSLGSHKAMLLRNHGLITVAESIPQAFMTAYYLERSCRLQRDILSTGRPFTTPPPEICEKTAQQFEGPEYHSRTRAWEALARRLQNRRNHPFFKGKD